MTLVLMISFEMVNEIGQGESHLMLTLSINKKVRKMLLLMVIPRLVIY